MENERNEEIEIDLLELILLLKEKIWVILAVGILFGAITGVFTKFVITPMYSSTSKLYILSTSTSLTSFADIQIGTSLTKDYVQLVQSRPVVEKVIENLNLNRTYEEVLKQMTVSNPQDTRILVITAEDADPVLAKDLVDEFADVACTQIASIMKTEEPSIVERGHMSGIPVSPSMKKNVMIGVLLGMFLVGAVVIVLYLMDDTVKSPEDIEKHLSLNTLAAIPLKEDEEASVKKRFLSKKTRGKNNGK